MKYKYKDMPENLKEKFGNTMGQYGFSWKEFVVTVPSPLFLVTSYKSNGKPNACMQSWATFTSADRGNGFYAILASVNKTGHLYQSIKETKQAVINFFSEKYYVPCMATIQNNGFDVDEITASRLTAKKAEWVNAPVVEECFMNLECKYVWEKAIVPGDDHVMICLEIIGAHIGEEYLSDKIGETGLLYNIHYPLNPEKVNNTARDYVGVIQKKIESEEY